MAQWAHRREGAAAVLDGHLLVDAHVHVPHLGTLAPAWVDWARQFGRPGILEEVWRPDGSPDPAVLDRLFAEDGVDVALLFCEYSPKATGIQPVEDVLPIVRADPQRFRLVANVNPHLHFPIAEEVERQLDLGAVAVKLHPVHGGFACNDRALYPVYEVCRARGVPVVVHCGTSSFPGSSNRFADPVLLDDVVGDFPTVDVVLAHGGRGWWYDAAAFMALARPNVWIDLSGLPPRRLPEYYRAHSWARLSRRFLFGTDWPGVPGQAANARAVAALLPDEETVGLVLAGNAERVFGV
jgi:predicted TIM-barrel fold metal-dependent hydrolase